MVEDLFHRGGRRGVAEAVCDAPPDGGAEAPPEIGQRFVASGAAQIDEGVGWDKDVIPAAIHAASDQIEAHGTGRIEASRHLGSRGALWGPCSQSREYRAAGVQAVNSCGFFRARRRRQCQMRDALPHDLPGPSPELRGRLAAFSAASAPAIHRLQVGLARLVLNQAPPAAADQLALALAFIEGRAPASELLDARQECWTYVGSLACGCSIADSASAHSIMTCLEAEASAHSPAALVEQAERVLRCGVAEARVVAVLGPP